MVLDSQRKDNEETMGMLEQILSKKKTVRTTKSPADVMRMNSFVNDNLRPKGFVPHVHVCKEELKK